MTCVPGLYANRIFCNYLTSFQGNLFKLVRCTETLLHDKSRILNRYAPKLIKHQSPAASRSTNCNAGYKFV